jgi:eukaryotic-like serine/threonine-protein kinase
MNPAAPDLNGRNQGVIQPPSRVALADAGPGRATKFGRYTLLKPLARGGMGEVYLATSGGIEGAERPCVVKLIRREHAADRSFLARFFDEARVQAQLQHPGVAQVLEAATDHSGMPYVVLEHVEGRNLGEVRQRAAQLGVAVSWADAVAVAVSLADALAHVHERVDAKGTPLQIVHRDLSPQNVMVAYGGDVKLIDFGTARGENRRCQTVAGVVFAKPGYVAPEVANNIPGGPQADIYGLGIILWELIMGRKFLVGDPEEHLSEVAKGRRSPAPVSLTNNVPLDLDTIIARMTAPDVRDRFQTAREVTAALLRTLKRAPSLADGERGVRTRIAHLMARLYPAEPMRSRAEFAQLLVDHKKSEAAALASLPLQETVQTSETELLPGTRYRIERQLAESAMSTVYEAEHVDLGRRVALKVLPKERCNHPRFERRFRAEARALAALRHQHVVQLHDFGVSQDGRPFYAMELLNGETLRSAMDSEPLPWRKAVNIAVELCSALSVVHEHRVVHRDIKPENVFLVRGGRSKLLDFGIAQMELGEQPSGDETEHSAALELIGTAEYMAPEQIGREPVDERADVYAVGVLLYEMVARRLPHQAEGAVALLDKKRHEVPPAPSKLLLGLGLPRELDVALLRALAPAKEARFASTAAFAEALKQTLRSPAQRRKRQTIALGLSLGLGALGLGVWTGDLSLGRWVNPTAEGPSAETELTTPVVLAEAAPPKAELQALPNGNKTPAKPTAILRAAETQREGLPGTDADTNAPSAEADANAPSADAAGPNSAGPDTVNGAAAEDAASSPSRVAPSKFEEQLSRAKQLASEGAVGRERALALLRTLAKERPDDPEVLEHWSKAAAATKWWGESLRAAIRWASVDAGEASHLHLARTQRLVGQRYGAIQTLERFLEQSPDSKDALSQLSRYRNDR